MESDDDITYSSDDESSCEEELDVCLYHNRYFPFYKLSKGAFSKVYLVQNMQDSKFYAMKIQNADSFEEGQMEVDTLKDIKHSKCKHLNKLFDNFVHDEDYICMVTSLMAGSLYDIMKFDERFSKGYNYKHAISFVYQTLLGMDYLNDHNYIHTDIKPENVFLTGERRKIKDICDIFDSLNLPFKVNKLNKKNKNKAKHLNNLLQSSLDLFKDKLRNNNNNKNNKNNDELIGDIDDKYVKLSDFGNCIYKDEHDNADIQTRHYCSPEVIMGCEYDEQCDIWSVPCMLYELLFGSVLFDPHKNRGLSRDKQQLLSFYNLLGKLDECLMKGKKKDLFFTQKGLFKNVYKLEYLGVDNLLRNKFNELSETDNKIPSNVQKLLIDFFVKTLVYNPSKRMSVKQCIKHNLFNDYKS